MPKDLITLQTRFPRDVYESLRERAYLTKTSMAQIVLRGVRKELEIAPVNCRSCGREFYLTENLEYLQGFCSEECQSEYHGASVSTHHG